MIRNNRWGTIESKLKKHKEFGREIRIPGGKSKDEKHASFGIIYRERHGTVEILVVPYTPGKEKYSLIDPEDVYPEDPRGTLTRELLEETGVQPQSYRLLGTRPVADNRQGYKGHIHIRYAYAVNVYDDSNRRTYPSPGSRIFPPIWVPIEALKREYLWDNHRWMLDLFEEYYSLPHSFTPKIVSLIKEPAA